MGQAFDPGQLSLCTLPVFTCGQRLFFQGDILAAAERSGELEVFLAAWQAREVLLRDAEACGTVADEGEVETFLEGFRYARDLVSGEDCEAWLEKLGLCFGDLRAFAERRVLAGNAQAGEVAPNEKAEDVPAAACEEGEAPEESEGDGGLPAEEGAPPPVAEILLDAAFAGWARNLARRMAVAAEAGCLPVSAEEEDWAAIEALFEEEKRRCAEGNARAALLRTEWMELTRVGIELLELDTEDAAREALLCVREEGASLTGLAEENRLAFREASGFLADYGEELRRALATACADDLLQVATEAGMQLAVRVLLREEPVLSDPEVAARVDAGLVEARLAVLESQHVRWNVRLDTDE